MGQTRMPTIHEVTLVLSNGEEVVLRIDGESFILDEAAAVGIDLPFTCLQGWCITCAGRVIDGPPTCIDNRAALRYYPEDQEAGFVLLCTALVRQNCRIATHQAQAMKRFRWQHSLPAPHG